MFASTTLVAVWTGLYLTGYTKTSDYLTGFLRPLLPLYKL